MFRHHCCSLPCVRVPRGARAAAVIAVAAVVDDVDPPTLGRGLYSVLRGLVQFSEVIIVMQQLLMSSTGSGLVLGSFRRRPPDVLVVKLHRVELVLAELIPCLLLVLHGPGCRPAGRRGRSKEGRGGGSEVSGNATQRLPPLAA
jgi:hypothetical protein